MIEHDPNVLQESMDKLSKQFGFDEASRLIAPWVRVGMRLALDQLDVQDRQRRGRPKGSKSSKLPDEERALIIARLCRNPKIAGFSDERIIEVLNGADIGVPPMDPIFAASPPSLLSSVKRGRRKLGIKKIG